MYELINASAVKAADKQPVATGAILDLTCHANPLDAMMHAVMRVRADGKDIKEFKEVVLLMETATRSEEGCCCAASLRDYLLLCMFAAETKRFFAFDLSFVL